MCFQPESALRSEVEVEMEGWSVKAQFSEIGSGGSTHTQFPFGVAGTLQDLKW